MPIDVEPYVLPYHISGNRTGKPLVLLHGFCEDHAIWQPLLPHLERERPLVLVDLPGFGQAPPPPDGSALAFYAKCVRRSLQAANLFEAPVLVGHSMGGYVSMAFAEQYPTELSGLLLFHSTSFSDNYEKKEARNKATGFVRKNGVGPYIKSLFPNLFGQLYKQRYHAEIDQLLADLSQKNTTNGVLAALSAMRDRPSYLKTIEKLQDLPIGFIIGLSDPLTSVQDTLTQLLSAQQTSALFLNHVGHMGMWEAPEKTANYILDFTTDKQPIS